MASEPVENGSPGALEDALVVDADVHLSVSPSAVAEYVGDPYRRTLETPSHSAVPLDGWDRDMGGKITRRSVREPADVREPLCSEFGIDHPVVNALPILSRIQQTGLAVALMRGYNDYLLDRFVDEGFFGLASVAPQDPAAAAEEVDRLGDEDGVVGVMFDSVGASPPLGDPAYDPVYRAAEDNGLAVAYHGSVNGGAVEFPRQNQGFEQFLEAHVLFHSWGAMLTLTSLIVNGVPEKFPDLAFVFLEAGVSWVPYLAWRLNKEYSIRRSEAPLLERSPEEYVRERCYFGTQPLGEPNDPGGFERMLELVGPDRVLFATDYPHWDFDHPQALDTHLRERFPESARDRLLSGNAIDAFGLDV